MQRGPGLAVAVILSLAGLQPAVAADGDPGAKLFARCYACHSLDPAERKLPGPNLHGVLGRRAGSLPGFEFSPAMWEAGQRGLVWAEAALDRFLADPEADIPGTLMAAPGIRDAEERKMLIEYLKRAK